MYQPALHREDHLGRQHDLIRAFPLGLLITMSRDGLLANPVPFHLDAEGGPNGVLQAHVARANPLWQTHDPAVEALVVFQGPQVYVSPNYYASKKETGRVVPTWNYACVQAYGKLKVIDDKDWLISQIRALTDRHEADQPKPWSIDDAPEDYMAMMMKGIVGIEIEIARLEGKWKMSRNLQITDRESLVEALNASPGENAAAVAALIDTGKTTP